MRKLNMNDMKKTSKMITLSVILSVLLSVLSTTLTDEYDAQEKVGNDLLAHIGISYEELISGEYVDFGESYSCIIWLKDVEIDEAAEAGIEAAEMTRDGKSFWMKSNANYSTYEVNGLIYVDIEMEDDVSDEYVQTYIQEERETAVKLYSESNSDFVAENFMTRDISVTYVSRYSPCIFADLSVCKIAELIDNEDVTRIGYIDEESGIDLGYYGNGTLSTQRVQQAIEIVRVDKTQSDFNLTGLVLKLDK